MKPLHAWKMLFLLSIALSANHARAETSGNEQSREAFYQCDGNGDSLEIQIGRLRQAPPNYVSFSHDKVLRDDSKDAMCQGNRRTVRAEFSILNASDDIKDPKHPRPGVTIDHGIVEFTTGQCDPCEIQKLEFKSSTVSK